VIDVLTVVFQQELYYLEIQARSIEQYINYDKIGKIFVIVNDEDSVCSSVDVNWWGQNSNKVEIVPRSRFGVAASIDGWSSQQLYKLFGASIAVNEWSMCLDAKTWFVKSLDFKKMFDESGRVNVHSFPTIPVFKSAEEFVEQFYNIESKQVIGPGGVPFFFHTETITDLIADLEQNHNTNLLDFFTKHVMHPIMLTEFMLYSGFVKYKYGTHDTLYSQYQYYAINNVADFQVSEFDTIFGYMQQDHNLTASIHRRVYPLLTDQQLACWVDFLYNKQLINDKEATRRKLNTN